PYGGLISGRPCTVGPPPPPSPPPPPRPPPPPGAGGWIGDPASVICGAPRPPPPVAGCSPPRPPPPVAGCSPPPRPPRPAFALGTAFGSRAVPWTQSKSERVGSGFTRPSTVGAVFVKM